MTIKTLEHGHLCRECGQWFECVNTLDNSKDCADEVTPLCFVCVKEDEKVRNVPEAWRMK